jgi:hypothetical protein
MDNFIPLRREFEEMQAIRVTGTPEELEVEVDKLLSSTTERDELGRRATACFREHLGAGSRCAEILLERIARAEKKQRD